MNKPAKNTSSIYKHKICRSRQCFFFLPRHHPHWLPRNCIKDENWVPTSIRQALSSAIAAMINKTSIFGSLWPRNEEKLKSWNGGVNNDEGLNEMGCSERLIALPTCEVKWSKWMMTLLSRNREWKVEGRCKPGARGATRKFLKGSQAGGLHMGLRRFQRGPKG